jgi:hypothetical protein
MAGQMRSKFSLVSALALTLAASPAWAAPATSDGAKAIAQGYAAWFTQAIVDKAIVTVTPQGDDYLVAWDLQKIVDLAKPSADAMKVDKFTYLLTPKGDDAWTVKADHFPSVVFNVDTDKGKMSGTVDLNGFHLETTYDGKQPQFFLSTLAATLMTAKIRVAESGGPNEIALSESGVSMETSARTAPTGIDLTINQTMKNFTQVMAVVPDGKGAKDGSDKVTFTTGLGTSDATFTALRGREIADLWKYVVAHAQEGGTPPELKAMVGAALPLWNEFRANAEVSDIGVDVASQAMPVNVQLKGLSEIIALSGFTPHGFAEFGLKLKDLNAKMPLLPDWSKSVMPASLDIDLKLTVDGLDQVARIALDDPNFGGKGDLAEETQNKITAQMMSGHPRLTISPGRFATPVLDLRYEGEVANEGEQPTGHFTLSADGLDRTQALVQEIAKQLPDAQPASLAIAFFKGLATTGGDGRLVWKIDMNADGGVTVNGNPMPVGK